MIEPSTDAQALTEFARTRSPAAFALIVDRHTDLVYATARRLVGDAHVAEDVTQAAFLVLAKKAPAVDPRTLPGWLVNTTRLAAREAMRSRTTRHRHEARAAEMRRRAAGPTEEPTPEQIAPLLDEALSRLGEADRSAVVMRFLQGLSFAEVGAAMGTSEEAARKRVTRALEKLRSIFLKRGLTASVAGLVVTLAAHQAPAAPPGLAAAAAGAAISGGTGFTLALAKGAMAVTTSSKTKFVLATLTLTIGVAAVAIFLRLGSSAPESDPPTAVVARNPIVYVHGVKRPGAYSVPDNGITLLELITASGGPTGTGDVSASINREGDAGPVTLRRSVPRLIDGTEEDVPLRAGDTVALSP